MRQLLRDWNFKAYWRRHPNRIFVVYFTAAVVFGFWRIESTISKVENEAKVRSYNQCVQSNQARAAIRDGFHNYNEVLIAAAGDSQRPLSPAEQADRVRAIAQFKEGIERKVIRPLAGRRCPSPPG